MYHLRNVTSCRASLQVKLFFLCPILLCFSHLPVQSFVLLQTVKSSESREPILSWASITTAPFHEMAHVMGK